MNMNLTEVSDKLRDLHVGCVDPTPATFIEASEGQVAS